MTHACDYDQALAQCLNALSSQPSALFTDIDGTVSEIARRPEEATIAAEADHALSKLANRLAMVALVTGRSIRSAQSMTSLSGVTIFGNHGLERTFTGEPTIHPKAVSVPGSIDHAMAQIESQLAKNGEIDGLVFENKALSGSIHYRLTDNPDKAERRILEVAQSVAREAGLKVTQGRFVIELRPDLNINKGTVISDAIQEMDINGAIFLGDDITDVDGFHALTSLKSDGVVTVSVAVVSADSNPLVAAASDCCVEGVKGAVRLLEDLGRQL